MPVLDIDGTTKMMFGISVGNKRVDIRSNNGVIEVRNNLGIWRPIETAVYMKLAAPTVNDDSSQGYLVSDAWFYDRKLYICEDNAVGAAVWTPVTIDLNEILVANDSSIVVDNDGNIVTRS